MPRRATGVPPEGPAATPPLGGPSGFQGWTEAEESQLELSGPQAADPELLACEVRVVYLGLKRFHSIPLPGGLVEQERADGTLFAVPAPRAHEGILSYNFDGVDQRGRSTGFVTRTEGETTVQLPRVRRTERDHRPWAICRHIGHAAWFLNKRDLEGNPEYQLRAPEALLQKIQAYDERRKRRLQADPDSPDNVLREIQPAEWRERGGEIGEPLA